LGAADRRGEQILPDAHLHGVSAGATTPSCSRKRSCRSPSAGPIS
jgi:hypothetical protein